MRGLLTTMRRGGTWWIAGALLGLAVPRAEAISLDDAMEWGLRLTGGMHGVYAPVPERPLAWNLVWAATDEAGRRTGEVRVAGEDFSFRVALDYRAETGRLSWRVVEGRVDLATWIPALATRPEWASLQGVSATGSLTIFGEGACEGGQFSGALHAQIKNATLRNDAVGWSLEGVTLDVGGAITALRSGRVPLALDVKTISTGRFGARNLVVASEAVDLARVEVSAVNVEIAGGRLSAAPFSVSLANPVVDAQLSLERIGLQDVAALVPDTLAEATGRVNGSVRLGWSRAQGFTVGEGGLSLDTTEIAQVRFRPVPGLLTGSLPAVVLKCYPGLAKIETGETALMATRFELHLSPEGDGDGRSAVLQIEGEPVDPRMKAPLVLTVNVRGPLAPLIKFGSTPGLGFGK